MRKLIREAFPSHNIFGEEEGFHEGSPAVDSDNSSYLWVLDPIDGTKSFITGELHPSPPPPAPPPPNSPPPYSPNLVGLQHNLNTC